MLSTPKAKGELFLASSLCDGLEDTDLRQITTLLESKEADPNVLLPIHGITPFHLVIGNESELFAEKVTKLFLRHGGNPNVKSNDGMTPVHVAAAWGRVKILELLLANGGDPLCLDDDGRTPFHYAFDGAYYDAITVLGKYCSNNQDIDEDDNDYDDYHEENNGKIEIKLEKILINRGDVIAEYLPTEIDVTNKSDNVLPNNLEYRRDRTSPENTEIKLNSVSDINLNSNNITFRRGQQYTIKNSQISPILGVDSFNFDLNERNGEEEKVLVGQIINRLSNSFNLSDIKSSNEHKITNNCTKKFRRLLPQSKYFKNNLNSMKPELLDTSIVSKSPNFKIPIKKKIEVTKPTILHQATSPICTKKQFNQNNTDLTPTTTHSSPVVTPQIKNASSTPKKKLDRNNYELEKLFAHKITDRTAKNVQEDRTYMYNNYDNSLSPDIETDSKPIRKKELYKNIVRKLDTTVYGDDCEGNSDERNIDHDKWNPLKIQNRSPGFRSKFTKLFNKVDCKSILGIAKIKSPVKLIKHFKPQTIDRISPIKCENNKAFLESPGSSHPTSASYQCLPIIYGFDSSDRVEVCDELDEIYKNKGSTPPASISKLTNDSLTSANTSKSSPYSENQDITINRENPIDNSIVANVDCQHFDDNKDNAGSNKSSSTETYRTPMRSSIRSRAESFTSVDEEYAYVDPDKNVAFMERRLRVLPKVEDINRAMSELPWLNRHGDLLNAVSPVSPRSSNEFSRIFSRGEFVISNASLRNQLIALGDAPGPITDTTHYVYLKRLYKLKHDSPMNLNKCLIASQSSNESIPISPKISNALLNCDFLTNPQFYRDLEELAFHEYQKPNGNRKYRGGMGKTSFNYLLLDPRITNDLPRNGRKLCFADRWEIFLKAIFYVGKGKNSRPFAHLYESHEIWTGKRGNNKCNEKSQRILDIWREGKGVICHQIFGNSMQEEAFTREAAMIDALGTNYLSNCNRGNYYGLAATMSSLEKKNLGKYLLYKAMEILMFNGESQQFPRNIE